MPAPLDRILHPVDISPFKPTPPPPVQSEPINASTGSLDSYIRVRKACNQCRRDKTRCDKARPCNGCVKRGRTHLCFDGCVACRKGRLRCDRTRPCTNCIEHGRECVEDEPTAIAPAPPRLKKSQQHEALIVPTHTLPTVHPSTVPSPTSNTPPPPPSDSSKSRTRTHNRGSDRRGKLACLACRRDSKKCARGQPCARCVQRDEQCVYVARAQKLVKQRCALCRKKNRKCEETRPCQHCVKADVTCVDLPRKGTGPGLRVQRACEGCRADKVQCEEARPCAGCKKKKIPCIPRECKTCSKGSKKCGRCVRFQLEHSPSESDSNWEDLSTPPMGSPSSHSSKHALDPRLDDKLPPPLSPPTPHDYTYSLPQSYSPTFYTPIPGPSFPPPGFPSSPSMHPMRPMRPSFSYPLAYASDRSSFYPESPRLLPLEASVSDVRTRTAHLADD